MILYWNTLCLLFVNSAQHFAAVTSVPMQPRGGFPFNIAFPTKEKHHGGSMFRTHCPHRGSHLPNQMRKRSSYDPQHRSCGLYRLRNLHQDMPTGCFQARTRARGPFPLHGGLPRRGRHSRQPLPDPAGAPWRSGPALPHRPAVSGHHGPGMFPSLRGKSAPGTMWTRR